MRPPGTLFSALQPSPWCRPRLANLRDVTEGSGPHAAIGTMLPAAATISDKSVDALVLENRSAELHALAKLTLGASTVLFVIADEKRNCKWLGINLKKASRPFDPSCLSSRSRADPGAPLQGAGEANRKLVGAVGEIGFAPAPQARIGHIHVIWHCIPGDWIVAFRAHRVV